MIKKPRGKQEDKKKENQLGRKIKRLWQYRNPHKETREAGVGPALVCGYEQKAPWEERKGGRLHGPSSALPLTSPTEYTPPPDHALQTPSPHPQYEASS